IRRKDLAELGTIDKQKPGRIGNRAAAEQARILLEECGHRLARLGRKGGDKDQRLDVWIALRRASDHRATVRMAAPAEGTLLSFGVEHALGGCDIIGQ